MKKFLFFTYLLSIFAFSGLNVVQASTYYFSPNQSDLQDLDHNYYYSWSINSIIPEDQIITDAVLTFNKIYDFISEPNDWLYINLLDNPPTDGTPVRTDAWRWYDHQLDGNDWDGRGPLVGQWNDPNGGWQYRTDLTYDFAQLGLLDELTAYLADGTFGFGIDPDCQFNNEGIYLTTITPPLSLNPAHFFSRALVLLVWAFLDG